LQKKVETAQEIELQDAELARLAAEVAARRTFGDAIEQWEKLELSRRKDGGKEAMRGLQKDVLPVLGGIALVDVKRAMLVDILGGVVERGARVMANHLFGDLRQFFNFALAREWIDAHPLAGLTKEKIGGCQKERDRYLSEEEIIELNQRLPTANLREVIERCLNHVEGNKLKRIYQRHELKAEQREAWRLLGDRRALLHSADAHENTEHPAVVNSGTAQPAVEPQALGPRCLGAKGAVAECGRERRGLNSNGVTEPVCRSLRRQSGGPESWHGVARRGACRVARKRRDGRTDGFQSPDRQKALHLAMQSLGSEASVSLSSPAGVCYPKVILQAQFIGNTHIVVPGRH